MSKQLNSKKGSLQRLGKPSRPHESETHGICHSYLKTGKCEHGADCKYLHVEGFSLATGKDAPRITQGLEKATECSKELVAKMRSAVVVKGCEKSGVSGNKEEQKSQEDANCELKSKCVSAEKSPTEAELKSGKPARKRRISRSPEKATRKNSSDEDKSSNKKRSTHRRSDRRRRRRSRKYRRHHSVSTSSSYTASSVSESSSSDNSSVHRRCHSRRRRYRRQKTSPRKTRTDWLVGDQQSFIPPHLHYDGRAGMPTFPMAAASAGQPTFFGVAPFPLTHEKTTSRWRPDTNKLTEMYYRYDHGFITEPTYYNPPASPSADTKSHTPLKDENAPISKEVLEKPSTDDLAIAENLQEPERVRMQEDEVGIEIVAEPAPDFGHNKKTEELRESIKARSVFTRIGVVRKYLTKETWNSVCGTLGEAESSFAQASPLKLLCEDLQRRLDRRFHEKIANKVIAAVDC